MMEILAYVTDSRDRVSAGQALIFHMEQGPARNTHVADLGKALKADVVQLKNGDHMLFRK